MRTRQAHIAIHYRGQAFAVSRNSLVFSGEDQGKGCCPFLCNPIPETYSGGSQASLLSCRRSPLETRLAEHAYSCLLLPNGNQGTFLLRNFEVLYLFLCLCVDGL